ncbi:MAG TPA: SagB family peptide dehydrogenase [Vicinamibacterales bacterium]
MLHQYARGTRTIVTPFVMEILEAAAGWQPLEALSARLGADAAALRPLLRALVGRGLLESSRRPPHPADLAAATWNGWNPAAGFFHSATRDVRFWPREQANAALREKARVEPPPPPVTTREARPADVVPLPAADRRSALARTLSERRTWRRLGREPITLRTLATLLRLTWGVQAWVEVDGLGTMPLKTSPSGGARHPVEAYVAIRRVPGVAPGIYHYESSTHRLVRLRSGLTKKTLASCVPQQAWMADAPAMVFMTAVFARMQWRYPVARAYRTVLAEAGHHAQTFCLLATERHLAPFCTMALADTVVERLLGIDGLHEAALYAVGVGTRPPGTKWAPWPGTDRVPRRRDVDPGRAGSRRR